jgi:hypothetical protein
LQLAYLKASVVDIEVITDHAISSVLLDVARKRNISYILSGTNIQTETTMPKTWNFSKADHLNILSIHKHFGASKLKTYPIISPRKKQLVEYFAKIKTVSLLNYVNYNISQIKTDLSNQLEWIDYGGKHGENIWTKFYQNYILPKKFKIDKRKPHYSDLIFSGQITKTQAESLINLPLYDYTNQSEFDFILKKLNISKSQFFAILDLPVKSHYSFDYLMPMDKRYPMLKPIKDFYHSYLK